MAEVTLEEVTKIYGEDVKAVDKMNLDMLKSLMVAA